MPARQSIAHPYQNRQLNQLDLESEFQKGFVPMKDVPNNIVSSLKKESRGLKKSLSIETLPNNALAQMRTKTKIA